MSGGRDGIIHSWQWGKNMNTAGFIQVVCFYQLPWYMSTSVLIVIHSSCSVPDFCVPGHVWPKFSSVI